MTARRALLVTKTDPSSPRDGGTLRVAAVVAALEQEGWVVDVVAARDAAGRRRGELARPAGRSAWAAVLRTGARTALTGSASVARWYDPRVASRIAAVRAGAGHDLAVIEFSQLLVYRPLLADLPLLLDLHNLEAELLQHYAVSAPTRLRRLAARWEAARVHTLEGATSLTGVDGIVTVSERDAAAVSARVPGTAVRVAPNGVADAAFETVARPATAPTAVFVAHLGWRPNVDAALWLTLRAWPLVRERLPGARLQLIGRSPAPEVAALGAAAGVSVHPDVPSPLPFLAQAAVATAPLLAAGGTRLKIVEALATGTPVVATSLGALGLAGLPGLDVEDEPEAFAAALALRLTERAAPEPIRAGAEPYRWRTALTPLVTLADELATPPARDAQAPDFELVLVGYRSRGHIEALLAGLPPDLPAVLVDNSHDVDGLRAFAAARPGTRYLDAGGVGFARAANLGARTSEFDTLVFVNPDTRPAMATLAAIVADVRADPAVLSSSPLNVGPDGRPELGAAGWEPSLARALAHTVGLHKLLPRTSYVARPKRRERLAVDWVTGSCMAVDRERFESLGGFDERYFVYNEDMALGHAARRRGLRQRLRTDLVVPHAQGGSGAPSTEMVRLKGASMRRYLLHRRPRTEARLIAAILGAGFAARTLLFRALRRPAKAAEDAAYLRGIMTGRATVGGVVVTDRE